MSTERVFLGQHTPETSILRNADRLWHLQKTGLTEGLTLSEMHRLSAICTDLIFEKNQVVFHQDHDGDTLFFVNRGTIRLTTANTEGREKVIAILGTGELFGEEALAEDKKRRAQAIAHDECWVSSISQDKLLNLMAQVPGLSLNFVRLLNGRLAEAHDELETLSYSSTEHRIAKTLLKLCRKHGKRIFLQETIRKLKIQMSHELLSQIIGANRPHVSAIMSEFKKKGWIQYQKRKLLVDIDKLGNLLEGAKPTG